MRSTSTRHEFAVHGLYFLSGAAALALEVVWMGVLGRTFGSTAEAAGATLAAFFLGLGLGAAVVGRLAGRVRRPLRAYGLLEIGVALAAVLSPTLMGLAEQAYGAALSPSATGTAGLTAVRLGLAFLLVGPPAFLMGGTLPLLGEHLVRVRGELGRKGSLLYGVNTLGAAGGALVATFVLPWSIGWRATGLVAAAVALAVGLAAWALSRRVAGRPPPDAHEEAPPARGIGGLLPALAFASGLLSLALQVLWTRMFAQAFPGSIYVFGTVVVAFLLALGFGALVARGVAGRARRTRAPDATLTHLLAFSALLVAATIPAFLLWTNGLRPPAPGQAWGRYVLDVVLGVALVVFPAVVAMGTILPWLMHAAGRAGGAPGRSLGRLAAWNTAGAIAGALLAAFVCLRALGLWPSIAAAAGAYALLALGTALRARRALPLLAALLAVAGVAFTMLRPVAPVRLGAREELVAAWEGPAGTVSVLARDGHRRLVVDNVFSLGGTHDERWEALQAHVPLAIHPAPRSVFFLGLGTGIPAGAALDHHVERLRAAELVPEVIEAAHTCFAPWANGLFEDPRAVVLEDDARHHLRWSRETYDVVVGDLFFPWEPGAANLYTEEHFRAVRARLARGGLFAQWLPCYQLSEAEFLGIARTMSEVFPLVTLWRGDFFADRPLLAVVGHRDAVELDPVALVAHARALLGGSGDDLARDADTVPLHLYAGNLSASAELLKDARILTDDRPWIAASAPRSERQRQGDPSALFVAERLLTFEVALRTHTPVAEDPYLERLDERQRRYVEAGLLVRRMAVDLAAHRRSAHARALLAYVRLVPADARPDLDRWVE